MFKEHRKIFTNQMKEGVAIFFSAPCFVRNNDVYHEYRQDSNFYYLTGFEEPETVLVLAPDHPKHQTIFFVRPRDPEMEVWLGKRAGIDGVLQQYGADVAYDIAEFETRLAEYLQDVRTVFYRFGNERSFDDKIFRALNITRQKQRKEGFVVPSVFIDPNEILYEMRLRKGPKEQERMKQAAKITAEGHIRCMESASPGQYEYELEAILRASFRAKGARRIGYEPIVGSGPNATILHYCENNRQMQKGDLCLIDAGAEYGFYTADVTRTFPVDRTFSKEQQALYELCLQAQKDAIKEVCPGKPFDAAHQAAVKTLTQGFLDLGLLSGNLETAIEEKTYQKFYMHQTGHWLGMDVHDVGNYYQNRKKRPLEPGMVVTVEPGIYIAPDSEDVTPGFRGIGIRIEDDVLVTPDGNEVISESVPKEIREIETLRRNSDTR